MSANVSLMVENVIQIKSGTRINVGVSAKIQGNIMCQKKLYWEFCYISLQKWQIFKKYYWWFSYYVWWNCRYNKNSFNKNLPTNFKENKVTCKIKSCYILFTFLLIKIALLIGVSIYCYLVKYRAQQEHLLPNHVTNNKLE